MNNFSLSIRDEKVNQSCCVLKTFLSSRELKICDHDLDHFFHDGELIAIITEHDRDLFNFLFLQSQSFGHLYCYISMLPPKVAFVVKFPCCLSVIINVEQHQAGSALGWVTRALKWENDVCFWFPLDAVVFFFFFFDKTHILSYFLLFYLFIHLFIYFWCHDVMTKWESPSDVQKQLPPVVFGTWGGLGILPPLQPPTITSPLVKAGHVPPAGITEGTIFPTKNIQVQAQVSS